MQAFPRILLAAGQDWKKQDAVGLGCLVVAGCVADHQDFLGVVIVDSSEFQVLGFGAHLLTGDDFDEF